MYNVMKEPQGDIFQFLDPLVIVPASYHEAYLTDLWVILLSTFEFEEGKTIIIISAFLTRNERFPLDDIAKDLALFKYRC